MRIIGEFINGEILIAISKVELDVITGLLRQGEEKTADEVLVDIYEQLPIGHPLRRTINAVRRHHNFNSHPPGGMKENSILKTMGASELKAVFSSSPLKLNSRQVSEQKLRELARLTINYLSGTIDIEA